MSGGGSSTGNITSIATDEVLVNDDVTTVRGDSPTKSLTSNYSALSNFSLSKGSGGGGNHPNKRTLSRSKSTSNAAMGGAQKTMVQTSPEKNYSTLKRSRDKEPDPDS